jgi:ABC-type multidrug transport system ATPase subunit
VVGLIGHNGAGKTTLMQMIATLTRRPAAASCSTAADIARKPEAIRRRLGYLPQDFGVYRNVSALEFMQYFAALKGVRDPAASAACSNWSTCTTRPGARPAASRAACCAASASPRPC